MKPAQEIVQVLDTTIEDKENIDVNTGEVEDFELSPPTISPEEFAEAVFTPSRPALHM